MSSRDTISGSSKVAGCGAGAKMGVGPARSKLYRTRPGTNFLYKGQHAGFIVNFMFGLAPLGHTSLSWTAAFAPPKAPHA